MGNDTQPVRIGWLSLTMLVVMLCMAVLAMLSFATARADLALSRRYADTRTELYAQDSAGQALYAQADKLLAQGLSIAQICTQLGAQAQLEQENCMALTLDNTQGNRLYIRLVAEDGALRIDAWRHSVVWQQAAGETLWGTVK